MVKIGIYTFANTAYFVKELIKYNATIEWYTVLPRFQYKDFFTDNSFYLYENFELDYDVIVNFTDVNIFNFYKSLEIDKDGYRNINKNKQLKFIFTIYNKYKMYLLENKLEYFIFPDIETVDGIILLNLCYELNIIPIYTVHLRQLGKTFFSSYIDERLPVYFGDYTSDNIQEAEKILENFFTTSSCNLIRDYKDIDIIKPPVHSKLLKRIVLNIINKIRYEKYYYGEDTLLLKVKSNIVKYLEMYRQKKYNLYHKNLFDIKSNNNIDELPKNFILFALQVTPESSINSLEPYFIDQIRAIDLVRLSMPNNFYIVVKEHPSMRGIRATSFYKELRKKAGVILVSTEVNTKEVMNRAKLISTVTGTIALESWIMNKPALMFGKSFFSHLIYRYDSYLNFQEELKKMIFEHKPMSREEKIIELAKLYNISYSTMLFDPIANPIVMEKGNIKNYLLAIQNHIKRVEEYKNKVSEV